MNIGRDTHRKVKKTETEMVTKEKRDRYGKRGREREAHRLRSNKEERGRKVMGGEKRGEEQKERSTGEKQNELNELLTARLVNGAPGSKHPRQTTETESGGPGNE